MSYLTWTRGPRMRRVEHRIGRYLRAHRRSLRVRSQGKTEMIRCQVKSSVYRPLRSLRLHLAPRPLAARPRFGRAILQAGRRGWTNHRSPRERNVEARPSNHSTGQVDQRTRLCRLLPTCSQGIEARMGQMIPKSVAKRVAKIPIVDSVKYFLDRLELVRRLAVVILYLLVCLITVEKHAGAECQRLT